jgi:hypothetical protein
MALLVTTDEGLHWPDTPTIAPNGDLVFISSNLNQHFAGAIDAGKERYELRRLTLSGDSE